MYFLNWSYMSLSFFILFSYCHKTSNSLKVLWYKLPLMTTTFFMNFFNVNAIMEYLVYLLIQVFLILSVFGLLDDIVRLNHMLCNLLKYKHIWDVLFLANYSNFSVIYFFGWKMWIVFKSAILQEIFLNFK